MSKSNTPKTDVSDRLLAFVSGCLGLAGELPDDKACNALADSLLKPSVASYFRHGEAEGSPTAKEFAEKFREVLKELRTTRRALKLIQSILKYHKAIQTEEIKAGLYSLLEEADVLIRIFFSSVRTLENKMGN